MPEKTTLEKLVKMPVTGYFGIATMCGSLVLGFYQGMMESKYYAEPSQLLYTLPFVAGAFVSHAKWKSLQKQDEAWIEFETIVTGGLTVMTTGVITGIGYVAGYSCGSLGSCGNLGF